MDLKIKALSPMSHGSYNEGVDTGNIMQFRRMPVVALSGSICSVPVVSGNALRGVIRRYLARELFDTLALKEALAGIRIGIWDRLYTVLANGGTLSSDMATSVSPERVRDIRANIPMFSLLGGAAYHYIMPGMVDVGFAVLDCSEIGTGDKSARDLTTDIGQVRHIDRTIADTALAEAKPMPYTIEAVIQGSTFSSTITTAPQTTDIETSCLHHALLGLHHVGGKGASGYGRVGIQSSDQLDDSEYVAWLADHRGDGYVAWINDFAAEL